MGVYWLCDDHVCNVIRYKHDPAYWSRKGI